MPPSRRQSAAERRANVLTVARAAFVTSGYGGATMRSIAAAAGIDQAMLYRFFPSKQDLFEASIATPLEEAVNRMQTMSLTPSNFEGDYDVRKHALDAIGDLLGAMRDIAPLLGVVLTTDEETGIDFYRTTFEPSLIMIRDVLHANLAVLEHREFDGDLVVRAVIGTCLLLALDERFGSQSNADDAAPELVRLLLDGLLVPGQAATSRQS